MLPRANAAPDTSARARASVAALSPRAGPRPFALALLATVLAAGGCSWFRSEPSTGAEPKLPPDAVAYRCDQNKRLVVRYPSGGKYAMVMLPEREFRLDAVPAASGARYSNGRTTLFTKGDEAFLEDQGAVLFANCQSAVKK